MDEQLEFVRLVTTRLESADIPYMVTGSVALAVYAVPRMTRDVDVVVECGPDDAARIAKVFEADCHVDEELVRDAAAKRGMFNIIHNEWIIKADFIVRKDTAYRRLEFERRRRVTVEEFSLVMVAPEDLILSKLCWGRDAQSELQVRDARQVIGAVTDLDWPYLEKWAETLEVGTLLQRVRTG